MAARVSSHQEDIERLDSIPGLATGMAEQILSEIGTHVKNRFLLQPTCVHGLALFLDKTKVQGKENRPKQKTGNKYLRSALTEAAYSVRGSKNYLGALYRRTASRKGKKRAGIVGAHAMLRIAYYLLTPERNVCRLR
ncbi:transposase [Bacillus sp. FJAT-27225]|uniref:transposase n=1 Tax=Bacillus sp. FJAT-27225 TaxID=1743144 RepID=UPI000A8B114B|nr:transposase [Bacillus sp. FJAT-27225]